MTKNHCGSPRDPGADLFGTPDPELGPVVSATTDDVPSMRAQSQKRRRLVVPLMAILFALVGALVGLLANAQSSSMFDPGTGAAVFGGAAAVLGVGLGFALLAMLPQLHHSTYVCERGLARFGRRGRRIASAERVHFRDVADVKLTATTYTVGGAAIAETRTYSFVGRDGRELFRIVGNRPFQGDPPDEDPVFFGMAAEIAWVEFREREAA